MFKNARKSVLIISILSFVFSATGLMMLLHIYNIEHSEKHDSEHCPICRQSLIKNKTIVPESHTRTFHIYEISYAVTYINFQPLQTAEFQFPLMRASPPVC